MIGYMQNVEVKKWSSIKSHAKYHLWILQIKWMFIYLFSSL